MVKRLDDMLEKPNKLQQEMDAPLFLSVALLPNGYAFTSLG